MNPVAESVKENIGSLVKFAHDNHLINLKERQCFETGNPDLESVTRLALAIPFDYSALNYLFLKNVSLGMSPSDAYRSAIISEPENMFYRWSLKGVGVTCLTGSYFIKALFEYFNFSAKVIGVKEKRPHFANLVEEKYYVDFSLNLQNPLLNGFPSKNLLNLCMEDSIVYLVDSDSVKRLWELDLGVEHSFEFNAQDMFEYVKNNSSFKGPYPISIGTVRDVSFIETLGDSPLGGLSRIRVKYDKTKYQISIQNRDGKIIRTYPLLYDSDNRLQGNSSDFYGDLERLTGINLRESCK